MKGLETALKAVHAAEVRGRRAAHAADVRARRAAANGRVQFAGGVAAGLLLGVAGIESGVVPFSSTTNSPDGNSTPGATQPAKTDAPSITFAPTASLTTRPTETPAPTATETPKPLPSNPDVIKMATPEAAAAKYGIPGEESADPNNWSINEWGGANFNSPDGKTSKAKTDGAVVELWVKLDTRAKNPSQSQTIDPRMVEVVDASGGTWWNFGTDPLNITGGFNKISREQKAAETQPTLPDGKPNPRYQKNVNVLDSCLVTNKDVFSQIVEITSREQAADLFGVPGEASADFNNWTVNADGGANFNSPDGKTSKIKTNWAVVELWAKLQRGVEGNPSQTQVVDPRAVILVDASGGTWWYAKDTGDDNITALFNKILRDVIAAETSPIKPDGTPNPRFQKDVNVIPIGYCTPEDASAAKVALPIPSAAPSASPDASPLSYDRSTSRNRLAYSGDVFYAPSARNANIGRRGSGRRMS